MSKKKTAKTSSSKRREEGTPQHHHAPASPDPLPGNQAGEGRPAQATKSRQIQGTGLSVQICAGNILSCLSDETGGCGLSNAVISRQQFDQAFVNGG